jgi:transposase
MPTAQHQAQAIPPKRARSHGRDTVREAARSRGICPAIPYTANAKERPTFFPNTLYRGRSRIEPTMGKLKRFKRIALRCEKTDQNYGSFVALALGFILINATRPSVRSALGVC